MQYYLLFLNVCHIYHHDSIRWWINRTVIISDVGIRGGGGGRRQISDAVVVSLALVEHLMHEELTYAHMAL